MLTPEYLASVTDYLLTLYDDVEVEILKDIARRIKNTGYLTNTAQRQAEVLIENGMSLQGLQEVLKPYLKDIDIETRDIFDRSCLKHYEDEKQAYEKVNKRLINYQKNEKVRLITRQYRDELLKNSRRLTNSLGIAIDGNKQYTLNEFFKRELNKHILMVSSGAFDLDSAMRKLVNSIADSGVKTIDYMKSGRSYTLESSAKMLIRTSLGQATSAMSLANALDMDQDLMEISAHAGARPSHAAWQGKIVSLSGKNSKYLTLSDVGHGEVTGIFGANCRHNRYPFFEGVSERMYSQEYLDNIDPEPFEFRDKKYTFYEATQKQRSIERTIRKYKRQAIMYDEIGDKEMLTASQIMIRRQMQLYKEFTDAGNLKAQSSNFFYHGYNNIKKSKSKVIKEIKKEKNITYLKPDAKLELNLQNKSNEVYKLFSDSEWKALSNYTTGGYLDINGDLASGNNNSYVKDINKAIDKFTLDENITTYRGTKLKYYENSKVGDVIDSKVFYSTSLDRDQAYAFYEDINLYDDNNEKGALLEINVPKNTKCLYVGKNTEYEVNEKELLLSNKLKYLIKSIDGDKLILEVIT